MTFPLSPRAQRTGLALLLLGAAFAVKWWYRTATVDELTFLLKPIAGIIGFISGEAWQWSAESGAYFPTAHILIDRSCSGINFLVITTATFAFLLLKNSNAGCARPMLAFIATGGAIALTIGANSARILSMLWLKRAGFHLAPMAHEAVGAFFFLSALLLASVLLDRSLRRAPIPTTIRSTTE